MKTILPLVTTVPVTCGCKIHPLSKTLWSKAAYPRYVLQRTGAAPWVKGGCTSEMGEASGPKVWWNAELKKKVNKNNNNNKRQWNSTAHLRKRQNTQNTDNIKWWPECGAIGTLIRCRWGCKMDRHLGTVLSVSCKQNVLLSYGPAINPKELRTYIDTKFALECL